MKRIFGILATTSLFLFLTNCGGESREAIIPAEDELNSEENTDITEPEYIETNWDWLQSDNNEIDTYIIVEGYIGQLSSMIFTYGDEMDFSLFPRRHQQEGFKISAYAPIGDEPGQIHELKEKYTPDDLKIVCDDGSIATTNDKVRIKGRVRGKYDDYCSVDVQSISKLTDNFSDRIFENAVELTQQIIDDTTQNNVYSYMDGQLSLPISIFSMTGDISLDFKQGNNKGVKSVSLSVGDGPGQMNDIPDNYSSKDLIYRDYKGKELGSSDNIRVYGLWHQINHTTDRKGDFLVEEIVKR